MQNDVRLIDANALDLEPDKYNTMNGVRFCGRGGGRTVATVQIALKHMIENAPTVDAAPVVHAMWVASEFPQEKYCCSACGGGCWYYDYGGIVAKSRCCPNCGAKMDGGATDENA